MSVTTRYQRALQKQITIMIAVFSTIASFLTPHDLLNFASSNPTLTQQIDYFIVVFAGMCNGNYNTRKTLYHLLELTEVGSIYLPCPMRLLRLICVRKCENCKITNLRNIPRYWGLALCFSCIRRLTSVHVTHPLNYQRWPLEYFDIFRHPRLATKEYDKVPGTKYQRGHYNQAQKYFVFNETFFDSFGQPQGPYFFSALKHVLKRFYTYTDVDNYLRTNFNAPPLPAYEELNRLICKFRMKMYERIQEGKQARYNAKLRFRKKKLTAVIKILIKLEDLLNPRMCELIRFRHYNRYYMYLHTKRPLKNNSCYIFLHPSIHQIMLPYLLTPSILRSQAQYVALADHLNSISEDLII